MAFSSRLTVLAARATRVAPAHSLLVRGMASGTVKWFNITKGFGFITPDEPGQPDVFCHQTAVMSTGFRFLREGERVDFEPVQTDRGIQAANVTSPGGEPLNRPREEGRPSSGGAGGGAGGGGGRRRSRDF